MSEEEKIIDEKKKNAKEKLKKARRKHGKIAKRKMIRKNPDPKGTKQHSVKSKQTGDNKKVNEYH